MKLKLIAAAAATLVAMAMTAGAANAQKIYLKSPDLQGNVTGDGRDGQVAIFAVSEGVGNSAPTTGSARLGSGAGKASLSDITLAKAMDGASAKLREYALNGKRIEKVEIEYTKASGKPDVVYRIALKNAAVTGVNASASEGSGGMPTESVTLSFEEIVWTIYKVKPDQSLEETKFGWSVVQNRKL
jgi:type VI secretion system secreted protein Hcp